MVDQMCNDISDCNSNLPRAVIQTLKPPNEIVPTFPH